MQRVLASVGLSRQLRAVKKKSCERIDGIVALIMGRDLASREPEVHSIYEIPGEHDLVTAAFDTTRKPRSEHSAIILVYNQRY